MFGFDLVTVHLFALEIAVYGMQAQPVAAGNQAFGLFDVGAHLVDVAGLAGIVAGGLNTARKLAVGVLETRHVVGLPAVQRQRNPLQGGERRVGVHARFGITRLGRFVSFDNLILFHGVYLFFDYEIN